MPPSSSDAADFSRGLPLDLEPGTRIDRYRVEALIGRGALASVYKVEHLDLNQPRALKILRRASPGISARTMREGRLQAGLSHPNIVAVHDVIQVGGAPALVQEYVEGPSLDALLRQYQPSIPEVDALARQILSAVDAAHRAGLIHRDLKPANVLVTLKDGALLAKVADFGLAVAATSSGEGRMDPRLTVQGAMLGTPAYMAPEQYADAASVDARADVFGLGAMLYELLTGVMAFPGPDAVACYRSIASSSFRPVRELVPMAPERMVLAITGALEPEAERRVGSVAEMLALWTGEALGERVPLRDPGDLWDAGHRAMILALTPGTDEALRVPVGIVATPAPGELAATPTLAPPPALTVPVPSAHGTFETSFTPPDGAEEIEPWARPMRPSGRRLLAGVVGLALLLALVWGAGAWLARRSPPPGPVEAAATSPDAPRASQDPAPAADPEVVQAAAATPAGPATSARATPRAATRPSPARQEAPEASVPAATSGGDAAPTRQDNVTISGVSRAYLLSSQGRRYSPGVVPPGTYTLSVFFDDAAPTSVMTLDVVAGRTYQIRCEPGLRVCR